MIGVEVATIFIGGAPTTLRLLWVLGPYINILKMN